MATIQKPELLLLDEHTAALDPNTSHQLLELTNEVVEKEKNLTCIMITHQMKDALKYGNRTVILNDGKVVLDAKGAEREKLTEEVVLKYFAKLSKKATGLGPVAFYYSTYILLFQF